eukprot:c21044_g5_i1 orf=421-1749(-)
MAQIIEGDSRVLHRGLIGNPPGLPPRFPTISNRGLSLSDLDTVFNSKQDNTRNLGRNHRQHKYTPSCCIVMQNQPVLLDKLLEESEVSINKGSHRRCASDSFTYLEKSRSLCMFSNIAEEDESECQSTLATEKVANHGIEDGNQLTDLLEEIQQLQDQQNLPISVRSQAVHLNCDSSIVNPTSNAGALLEATAGQLALDPRSRTSDDREFYFHDNNFGDPTSLADLPESDLDPKRAKRVLANRQSAQRSRVRKLQYIAELEKIVSTLQAEVSSLSLQALYLKHQRALLNMDNNALKQQAVFFVQEKRNKDSQNEILMHDIRRLQKLSEFQLLQKSSQMQKQQQPQHRHIQRHSSLPTDFVAKMHLSGELNMNSQQTKADSSSMDGLTGLMKDFGGMSLDAGLSREKLVRDADSGGSGRTSSIERNTAIARESFDREELAKDT